MELIIIFPKTCHDVEKYPISISGQSQILGKPWKAIAKPKETEGKLRKTMKNPWKSASPKQPSEHLPIGTRPLLPRRARPRPSKPPCSWCRHLRPWCPPAWEYWELGPKFMATSMGNHGNIWQNHETSKKFGVKIVKYLCFTQKTVWKVFETSTASDSLHSNAKDRRFSRSWCELPGIFVLLPLQHCFWSCTIGSTLRQRPKPVLGRGNYPWWVAHGSTSQSYNLYNCITINSNLQ